MVMMMFDNFSDKLVDVFKKLKGYGKFLEKNIEEGFKEVCLVLFEVDVYYKVVKSFIVDI